MQNNGQQSQHKKWQQKPQSNHILLVCSDIFGISPVLHSFFNDWSGELQLLSPYTKQQHFSDEEQAYEYFQQQGGLDSYRQKLRHTLNQIAAQQQQKQQAVIAVGFSAGAAALWCELGAVLAHQPDSELEGIPANSATVKRQAAVIEQAFCFYGGQIRHFADLSPGCPTTLLWAQERHFDVKTLATALSGKNNVSSKHCGYSHGFINPYSSAYHKQGAAYYQRWLMSQLHQPGTVE